MGNQDFAVLLLLVVGSLTPLMSVVHGQVEDRVREYGQFCNMTGDNYCFSKDIRDPLTCNETLVEGEHKCQCYSDMFRHDELGRCVSPEGHNCTVSSGDGNPIWTCTDFAQCWPNKLEEGQEVLANRTNGICRCDSDAKYDDNSAKCKLNFGSTRCKIEIECDVLSWLTCREGACVCEDEAHMTFNKQEGKCKVLAGGFCGERSPFVKPECNTNMDCTSDRCACKANFDETSERTCVKKYNSTCDKDSDCDPHFVCRNETGVPKTCMCRERQEYHEGACLLLEGEMCGTENSTDFNCTFRATCQNEICQCDEGYERAIDGKCMGLYGADCPIEENISCKSEDYLICDDNDKICKCMAEYEGDENRKKCRGYIGQNCRNDSAPINDDCIANSICLNNKCDCGEKQVPDQDKKLCRGVLNATCSTESPCSDSHFVKCDGNKCDCKNHDEQLPEGDRCVAKVDNLCGNSGEGILCVVNSTCSVEEPKRCRCSQGLVGNSAGICVKQEDTGSASSTVLMSGTLLALALLITV